MWSRAGRVLEVGLLAGKVCGLCGSAPQLGEGWTTELAPLQYSAVSTAQSSAGKMHWNVQVSDGCIPGNATLRRLDTGSRVRPLRIGVRSGVVVAIDSRGR